MLTESFELFADDIFIGSVMLLLEFACEICGPLSAPHIDASFDSFFVFSNMSEEIVLPNI
jgi:hypothetical protein